MTEDKSKSQIKREAKALQDLGAALVGLSQSELRDIPLPEDVLEVIEQTQKIKSHIAKKRSLQMLGGVLRHCETVDEIRSAYELLLANSAVHTARFHEVERWRDRLIAQDKDALTEFLHAYACNDIQTLRVLVRNAKSEASSARNPGAGKALFRFIRGIIE